MRSIPAMILPLILNACAPFVPVMDVRALPPEKIAQAGTVKVFMLDSNQAVPPIKNHLGMVEAYSCKHLASDPPASKGNALMQLRVKALDLGANAVMDVTFDKSDTDAWGTNCWNSIYASGMAVRIR